MKHILYFLFCCGIFSAAHGQNTDPGRLSGEWFLQPVLASDTATGHTPSLSFDLSKKMFKGFTGCNQMSGRFSISGDAISFDKNIVLTKVECEGFNEKEFVTNLLRVDHFQLRDGILTLLINKAPISKWIRRSNSVTTAE